MTDKTSNLETLYTWAIKTVCKEMEAHGFRIDIANEPADETVVFFIKSQTRYGIKLPKQDGSNLTACEAFDFFLPVNIKVDDKWRELARINLLGITAAEEEVKDFIARRVKLLFGA